MRHVRAYGIAALASFVVAAAAYAQTAEPATDAATVTPLPEAAPVVAAPLCQSFSAQPRRPKVNSSVLRPSAPVKADVRTVTVRSRVPLRLLSGWTGEGGFYSNVFGFLPFSLSTEPVDEIDVVELK